LQTRFDWVCSWGILKKSNFLTPPSTGLSGTRFSTLNSAGINDPEEPEKYNNTELKNRATFYNCHTALDTCCCEVIKIRHKPLVELKVFCPKMIESIISLFFSETDLGSFNPVWYGTWYHIIAAVIIFLFFILSCKLFVFIKINIPQNQTGDNRFCLFVCFILRFFPNNISVI
jgi:hypothetical protein